MKRDEKREPRRDAENTQAYYNSKSRHLNLNAVLREHLCEPYRAEEAFNEGDIANRENPKQ